MINQGFQNLVFEKKGLMATKNKVFLHLFVHFLVGKK